MRRCAPFLLLLVPCLLFVHPGELQGQIPEGMDGSFRPHPEAQDAISRLYSPFCPGFMLEVCTAQASIVLRDSIQALAYQGWSSDELVSWMLANHGEQYRAVPEGWGWGVWAWILPPLGLLTGFALVVLALRRFRPAAAATADRGRESDESGSGRSAAAGAGAGVSPEEEARLRSAIRELELSEDPSF
jgi:cytochrome c-type biogenesis protein CcmH/NrfF